STSGVVYYTNDRYIQNLAYCRLKNLTVGYTIPTHLTSKIGIKELRIYFSGENLATWTALKSKFLDPEQAAADSDKKANVYPWCKTYSIGLTHLLNNCRYEKLIKIYAGRNRRAGLYGCEDQLDRYPGISSRPINSSATSRVPALHQRFLHHFPDDRLRRVSRTSSPRTC
ncbi:MAG: hypothetical protein ACLTSJ_09970, partial [Alistipes communis]